MLSGVWLFATPWTAACQASLSTISQSLLRFMSIESMMLYNHLIFYCPILLPSIFPSIRVFSNESVLRIKWSKYWFNIIIQTQWGLVYFSLILTPNLHLFGVPVQTWYFTRLYDVVGLKSQILLLQVIASVENLASQILSHFFTNIKLLLGKSGYKFCGWLIGTLDFPLLSDLGLAILTTLLILLSVSTEDRKTKR